MIGIIGGTGLYQMEGLSEIETEEVATPFGSPSAPIIKGRLSGQEVAFLPRHGQNHELLPSEINFRANIWALKSVGVRRIFSVSAVGSLAHDLRPGELAIPSQYLDFTRGRRAHTFFGDGLVAHISTAEPSCSSLTQQVQSTASQLDLQIHTGKTYGCVEGPRLGNKAESHFLRKSDCHMVGMTNVPEVYLAREAQLCYCTIAVVTDYDCWLDDPSRHATVDRVISLYKKNLNHVQAILKEILTQKADYPICQCQSALQGAVLTLESALPEEKQRFLEFLRR